MLDAFNENRYALGVFIELSQAFDSVDHDVLLEKLDIYGIKGKNLKWFHSYLINIKQFLKYRDQNANLEVLQCGFHTRIFAFSFVNDLKKSTKLLEPIMFADDTNLFCTNKSI